MKTFHIDEPNEIGKKKQRVSRNDKMFFKQQVESVLKERKKMTEGNIKLKNLLKEAQDDTDSSVGLLLLHDKQLLCLKRTDSYWSIPKGHIKIDETPIEALHRELAEETQIVLDNIPKLILTTEKENGGNFHLYVTHSTNLQTPVLDKEHEDWKYYKFFDLPEKFDFKVLKHLKRFYSVKFIRPHNDTTPDTSGEYHGK
jgi:8-oxo-dGTP pyrophosphatase MutT (NUDIX family)